MDTIDLRSQIDVLRKEGFAEAYVVDDPPGKFYPPHEHPYRSVHMIIEGEMSIRANDKTEVLHPGSRSDVGANVSHEVTIGPNGCMYIVAEDQVAA